MSTSLCSPVLFFFNDTATTEIYTLSLHDALPISSCVFVEAFARVAAHDQEPEREVGTSSHGLEDCGKTLVLPIIPNQKERSEEHTSELQSHLNLVCRLLLEKKKIQPFLVKSCVIT